MDAEGNGEGDGHGNGKGAGDEGRHGNRDGAGMHPQRGCLLGAQPTHKGPFQPLPWIPVKHLQMNHVFGRKPVQPCKIRAVCSWCSHLCDVYPTPELGHLPHSHRGAKCITFQKFNI